MDLSHNSWEHNHYHNTLIRKNDIYYENNERYGKHGWLYQVLDSKSMDIYCPKLKEIKINTTIKDVIGLKELIDEFHGLCDMDKNGSNVQNSIDEIEIYVHYSNYVSINSSIEDEFTHNNTITKYDINAPNVTKIIDGNANKQELNAGISDICNWLKCCHNLFVDKANGCKNVSVKFP